LYRCIEDAMLDSVKTAVTDNVTKQKPYELFNGRLAMMGITAAFIGDKITGGLGPLEQINSETGVPVIDEVGGCTSCILYVVCCTSCMQFTHSLVAPDFNPWNL
jgi:hypothetical protein